MLSKEGERKERERGENSNVRIKDKVKTKQVNFLLIKTGKNSALLYGNFSTGKWDLWDFGIMGFGNYGICDLWDFGIMGEGGRRGAKQREKGRARALVHQKGLMRQYVLMLFQRERKGELLRVEKKQKELNAQLGELRRARDMWLEADKDEVTVVDSNEVRSGGVVPALSLPFGPFESEEGNFPPPKFL